MILRSFCSWILFISVSCNLIFFSLPGIGIFLTPLDDLGTMDIKSIFLGIPVLFSFSPKSLVFGLGFSGSKFLVSKSPYPLDLYFPLGSFDLPNPGCSSVYPRSLIPNCPFLT